MLNGKFEEGIRRMHRIGYVFRFYTTVSYDLKLHEWHAFTTPGKRLKQKFSVSSFCPGRGSAVFGLKWESFGEIATDEILVIWYWSALFNKRLLVDLLRWNNGRSREDRNQYLKSETRARTGDGEVRTSMTVYGVRFTYSCASEEEENENNDKQWLIWYDYFANYRLFG